jgi:hypothetical protein
LDGARVVQEALGKIDSSKLTAFVVWTPRYPGDSRAKALSSMKLVSDKRALHFWDGSGWLGRHYGNALTLPAKRKFAWDVYFVFDSKARWDKAPPPPTNWMHQLGQDDQRRLDGDKLREIVEGLLKGAK